MCAHVDSDNQRTGLIYAATTTSTALSSVASNDIALFVPDLYAVHKRVICLRTLGMMHNK